jgi:glycosyltransferase involved in cell wall biosynthesis
MMAMLQGAAERMEFDQKLTDLFLQRQTAGGQPGEDLKLKDIPATGFRAVVQLHLANLTENILRQSTNLRSMGISCTPQVDEPIRQVSLEWIPREIASVSIVCAVFNNSTRELGELFESVREGFANSLVRQKEFILVDDGSKNFSEITSLVDANLAHFAAAGIGLVLLQTTANSGPGQARALGLGACRYDLILMIDSDDLVHPLFIQMMAQELQAGSAVVSCDMLINQKSLFCASSQDLHQVLQVNGNGSCIGVNRASPLIHRLISSKTFYAATRLSHYEDWELNIFLSGLGIRISILPIALYHYRLSDAGRETRDLHLRQFAYYEAVRSAWTRLASEASRLENQTEGLNVDFTAFRQPFERLLKTYQGTALRGQLSKSEFRRAQLKVIARAIEKLLWADDSPVWWSALRRRLMVVFKR